MPRLAPREPTGQRLLSVALFALPTLHPLLLPWVGVPSHLLWWSHVLPVALATFNGGRRSAVVAILSSATFTIVGERLFGAGYGVAADWETVLALGIALTFTHLLVAGFALYARGVEQQLAHNAYHDALTGLANRALLLDRLSQALARAGRHADHRFAVVLFDLDRFKLINDGLGHGTGDELLREVARRMSGIVAPADTVARLGGDEFVVVLDEVESPRAATRIVRQIQAAVERPQRLRGRDLSITTSAGLVVGGASRARAEDLLRDADTAMYRAKARGRAEIEVFDPSMHADLLARLQLETDLRGAIDRAEFVLHYQPLVPIRAGAPWGFEALIRWRHPTRGLLPPAEFIGVAEETGLIPTLGHWVIRQACTDAVRLRRNRPSAPGFRMNVNVSPQQFADRQLIEHITAALAHSGLPAECLTVEMTEQTMVSQADTTIAALEHLRAMGVQVAVDDFGTGYSSLSYLHRFPISAVKIDHSFVRRMHEHSDDLALVRAICTLCRELDLEVVAEGVEHAAQLRLIQSLDVAMAQGFLFSEPLTMLDAERFTGSLTRTGAPVVTAG